MCLTNYGHHVKYTPSLCGETQVISYCGLVFHATSQRLQTAQVSMTRQERYESLFYTFACSLNIYTLDSLSFYHMFIGKLRDEGLAMCALFTCTYIVPLHRVYQLK